MDHEQVPRRMSRKRFLVGLEREDSFGRDDGQTSSTMRQIPVEVSITRSGQPSLWFDGVLAVPLGESRLWGFSVEMNETRYSLRDHMYNIEDTKPRCNTKHRLHVLKLADVPQVGDTLAFTGWHENDQSFIEEFYHRIERVRTATAEPISRHSPIAMISEQQYEERMGETKRFPSRGPLGNRHMVASGIPPRNFYSADAVQPSSEQLPYFDPSRFTPLRKKRTEIGKANISSHDIGSVEYINEYDKLPLTRYRENTFAGKESDPNVWRREDRMDTEERAIPNSSSQTLADSRLRPDLEKTLEEYNIRPRMKITQVGAFDKPETIKRNTREKKRTIVSDDQHPAASDDVKTVEHRAGNIETMCHLSAVLQALLGSEIFVEDMQTGLQRLGYAGGFDSRSLYSAVLSLGLEVGRSRWWGEKRRKSQLFDLRRVREALVLNAGNRSWQDPLEYLLHLLRTLKEEFSKAILKARGNPAVSPTPIHRNFSFVIRETFRCLSCRRVNWLDREADCLSVSLRPRDGVQLQRHDNPSDQYPIDDTMYPVGLEAEKVRKQVTRCSLMDLVQDYFADDELERSCSCGGARSIKRVRFRLLPRQLIVHVRRLSYDLERPEVLVKATDLVSVPSHMQLGTYTDSNTLSALFWHLNHPDGSPRTGSQLGRGGTKTGIDGEESELLFLDFDT